MCVDILLQFVQHFDLKKYLWHVKRWRVDIRFRDSLVVRVRIGANPANSSSSVDLSVSARE